MKYIRQLLLLIIVINIGLGSCSAQYFFRFEASISVKTKSDDGKSQLTMGKVYYSKKDKKLVYDIVFPSKTVYVIKDTVFYSIEDGKLVDKKQVMDLMQSTIFNLALEGKLADYGLGNSLYKSSDVKSEDGLVITTWEAKDNKKLGKIVTSTKDKNLYGIVFFDTDGKIVSKQLFKEYVSVKGVKFPSEIIQIFYTDGKESYQVMTFKDIDINSTKNEEYYNYRIPAK